LITKTWKKFAAEKKNIFLIKIFNFPFPSCVVWNRNYFLRFQFLLLKSYGSGSGSYFLPSYGSGYGSGSTSQKVTVPTVPVPVPQHWYQQ